MSKRYQVLFIGLTAAVLCMCVLSMTAQADSRDTIEEVYGAAPGGRLSVDTDIGSITVRPGRPDEVRITVTRLFPTSNRDEIEDILDDLDMDMGADNRGVTIDTRYRHHSDWSVFTFQNRHDRLRLRYEIVVPETYDVELVTRDDDIDAAGLTGSIHAVTSDGNVSIRDIDGPVTAKTSDGDIGIDTVSGDADAQTSDGNIVIDAVGAEVQARTSDGDITVIDAAGPVWLKTSDGDIHAEGIAESVECITSDGDIEVTLAGQPSDDCNLKTSDGDIAVTMDKDCGCAIDAHTSDGGIDFDEITVRLGRADRHNLVADMNGGGPKLTMRTSDGNIRLSVK